MPRPPRYTVDDLLDAAAVLLAEQDPSAVSMSAVARAIGAPSGSVYHRFPTRSALCGELWIRTEERFQHGFVEVLASDGDETERCVAAARYVVSWCRDHPVEARVLLAGPRALCLGEWPESVTARRATLQEAMGAAVAGFRADPERLRAAVVDVPEGVVRRHLVARQTVPDTALDIVEDCARALISRR